IEKNSAVMMPSVYGIGTAVPVLFFALVLVFSASDKPASSKVLTVRHRGKVAEERGGPSFPDKTLICGQALTVHINDERVRPIQGQGRNVAPRTGLSGAVCGGSFFLDI
ncbi:MAG: hypothetical protein R6W72_02530, partial [Desulfurivibrionaceae bacterium]